MIRVVLLTIVLLQPDISWANTDAEIYLQKMLDRYKSLSSYEDNGRSITYFNRSKDLEFSEELKFRTLYLENESLYFEWLEMPNEFERQLKLPPGFKGSDPSKPKKNTIEKDKNAVRVQYSFKEMETLDNLSRALSGAAGVSSGLSWMVPRYLSREIPCPPRLGAKTLKILNENKDIVSIELTFDGGDTEIYHIDKKTFLLRRVEEKNNIKGESTTYQIIEFEVVSHR